MGEAKRRSNVAVRGAVEALAVDTVGGRVQVRWNTNRAATPFGQLAFFIEFLNLTGLYRRWEEACPLQYAGPHGSRTAHIIGTWFLSVLAGHRRYAHIAALRADAISPQLLGLSTVVSEDTVRRALQAMEEGAGRTRQRITKRIGYSVARNAQGNGRRRSNRCSARPSLIRSNPMLGSRIHSRNYLLGQTAASTNYCRYVHPLAPESIRA